MRQVEGDKPYWPPYTGSIQLSHTCDGDECPNCKHGTVEVIGEEVRCKGECGRSVTHNPETLEERLHG